MASISLLLLSVALIHTGQPVPVGGRGLDLSMGGVRRQRRDLGDLMMSYSTAQGGGGANDLYDPSNDWRGRGLDQALKRLVERDQRKEEWEEQRAAYLAALLRLLNEAESAGLVGPGDVEVVEEEDEEVDEDDDRGAPGDFQGPAPVDYDETGRGMRMRRPPGAWSGLVEPQLAQALLDRMEPRMVQSLLERANQERLQLERANQERLQQTERVPSGLRRLVARILSSMSAYDAMGTPSSSSSSRSRARRDLSIKTAQTVGPAPHRRSRRSLDDPSPPPPSNDPPLLRVKRLEDEEEEEEQELHPSVLGLQRMKRNDTSKELNHGSRRLRRRRAIMNYNPQILMDQILEYMRE